MTETDRDRGVPLETELKLRIRAVEPWFDRLEALGFRCAFPLQEEVSLLWDREAELQNRDCALRTRRYGTHCSLTWKGPRQRHATLKIRPELETLVEDGEALENILRALGYVPVLRMVKHRAVYRKEPLVVCLDRTSFGAFLEMEGPEADLSALRETLGLSEADVEPRSYPDLYRLHGAS